MRRLAAALGFSCRVGQWLGLWLLLLLLLGACSTEREAAPADVQAYRVYEDTLTTQPVSLPGGGFLALTSQPGRAMKLTRYRADGRRDYLSFLGNYFNAVPEDSLFDLRLQPSEAPGRYIISFGYVDAQDMMHGVGLEVDTSGQLIDAVDHTFKDNLELDLEDSIQVRLPGPSSRRGQVLPVLFIFPEDIALYRIFYGAFKQNDAWILAAEGLAFVDYFDRFNDFLEPRPEPLPEVIDFLSLKRIAAGSVAQRAYLPFQGQSIQLLQHRDQLIFHQFGADLSSLGGDNELEEGAFGQSITYRVQFPVDTSQLTASRARILWPDNLTLAINKLFSVDGRLLASGVAGFPDDGTLEAFFYEIPAMTTTPQELEVTPTSGDAFFALDVTSRNGALTWAGMLTQSSSYLPEWSQVLRGHLFPIPTWLYTDRDQLGVLNETDFDAAAAAIQYSSDGRTIRVLGPVFSFDQFPNTFFMEMTPDGQLRASP